MTPEPDQPRLVCLVVTRDDADRLPAWLDAARPLADAILALDEGSSDASVALLEREPLVRTVLHGEPSRAGAARSRAAAVNRLIDAAAALEPQWLLWLDVAERVAPCDVEPLRDFLARDALPGLAYGLRSDAGGVAFRLFAHRGGQRLPPEASDDAMVPDAIPRARWMATTLTLEPVTARGPARDRAPGAPVLVPREDSSSAEDTPVISVVVISGDDDDDHIESAVRALLEQECPEPFEVIVVTSGSDRTADIVRERFPEAEVVQLPRAALPGAARNAGLTRARGDYVTFAASHIQLLPGSLAARVRAHDSGYLLVTAATFNGTRTWAGWAMYFLDHTALLPGRPSGEVDGPPPHCSYVRETLVALGGFPEDMRAGEDAVVDLELARRGYRAYLARDVQMVHHSRCRTARRLVRHHFQRGRAMARIELDRAPAGRRLARSSRRAFGLAYVPRRLATTTEHVRRWGDSHRLRYVWSLPLVGAGAGAAWAGFWFEATRAPRRRGLGLTRPAFAGTQGSPPPSRSGAQERGHADAVLAALYPLHPNHPWLARVPVPIRRITRRGLTRVAVRAHLLRCRNVVIVAVTGSAGKTTTKDLLGEMLAAAGPTVRTRHNENGLWGVPATLLAVRPSDRFAVIEVGIKRGPGEMRWMAGLFRPRVAVLTGIGTFHSEVLGSDEAIAHEKRALLERLGRRGTAVVNADDPLARAAAERLPCRVLLAGWAADADVRLLAVRTAWPHGLDLELVVGGRRMRARVGVHGRHLAPLVAMAVAAADAVGVPVLEALDAAGAFTPRVGRLSPTPGPRGSMLIVDDWKSRVPSAVAAVQALGDTHARRRVAVLGEVQVDEQTTDTYRPIAQALVATADRVIAVGRAGPPLERLLAQTDLAARLLQVADAEAAAVALSAELGPGDVALLHGAGHHDLELISLRLDPGTDPAWIRDWRLRPPSRVGRPVTEVLAVLDAEGGATILERHGEALTYAGTTGHQLTREGGFIPADDADVVAWCARLGVAPLLVLRAAGPEGAAAVSSAVPSALEHVVAHGHRGILLELGGGLAAEPRVEQLITRMTERLRTEGLWSGMVIRTSASPRYAALAAAVDLAVLDLRGPGGGSSWAERTERVLTATAQDAPARAVLLHVPGTGSAADDLTLGSSFVRDFGLRGFAVPAASMLMAADFIGHGFQIRRRAWPSRAPRLT
jgi:UDP-N-acetylmuramoyl-tripeptide--D-alanyl-D-alanine ligase